MYITTYVYTVEIFVGMFFLPFMMFLCGLVGLVGSGEVQIVMVSHASYGKR